MENANMPKSLLLSCAVVLLAVTLVACRGVVASDTTIPDPILDAPLASAKGTQTVVLAGGCFWGVEAVFENVKGVGVVKSGYAGGAAATANYDQVSSGKTAHAESVQIIYDPSSISYGQLLKVFFGVAHDPTTLNRQGPDTGTQYRSAIFYANEEQRRIAQAYIEQLNKAKVFDGKIVTQVTSLQSFYEAERFHQDYLVRNPTDPYVVINDVPKLERLRKLFPALYKGR